MLAALRQQERFEQLPSEAPGLSRDLEPLNMLIF